MGHIDVVQEVLTFLMSIGLGAAYCILYDIVRALHKTFVKGFFEVLVLDLTFWTVLTFCSFFFNILRCLGQVRLFVLIGHLIGFLLLKATFSRFVFAALVKLMSVFGVVLRKISDCAAGFLFSVEKNIKKRLQNAKKLLQHNMGLLYNQLKLSLSGRKRKKPKKREM